MVGGFDLVGFRLVAVHDQGHAKGEDEDLTELVRLHQAPFHQQSIYRLQSPRQHIHDQLVPSRLVLEH